MLEQAFFGPDARFHHVGLAVQSIKAVSPASEPIREGTQRVSLAFVSVGGMTIELLEPLGDQSPIARSLRDGVKLLHLCFEVPSAERALAVAKTFGFHRISRPVPSEAVPDATVVWVHHPDYGLFELLERCM